MPWPRARATKLSSGSTEELNQATAAHKLKATAAYSESKIENAPKRLKMTEWSQEANPSQSVHSQLDSQDFAGATDASGSGGDKAPVTPAAARGPSSPVDAEPDDEAKAEHQP